MNKKEARKLKRKLVKANKPKILFIKNPQFPPDPQTCFILGDIKFHVRHELEGTLVYKDTTIGEFKCEQCERLKEHWEDLERSFLYPLLQPSPKTSL